MKNAIVFVAGVLACTVALAGTAKTKLDTPVLSCASATQAAINVKVCAGSTGLPAGFSIQWETAAALALGPDGIAGTGDDNTWASSAPILCEAGFSGEAKLSRYNLTANQCVTVDIGEFLFDNGASTDCKQALSCGTQYVFRSFGHGNSEVAKSEWTSNLPCSTLACTGVGVCTYTQGYWKTHGPTPTGNNVDEWPVTSLLLGTRSYNELELQSIFDTPAGGNGLIALAHQLIAAKLNIARGSDGTAVAGAISAADTLIGTLVVPPVGSGWLAPSATDSLVSILTSFNEGAIGPGHCQ